MKVEPVSSNIVKNIKGSGRGIHATNIPERLFLSLAMMVGDPDVCRIGEVVLQM